MTEIGTEMARATQPPLAGPSPAGILANTHPGPLEFTQY